VAQSRIISKLVIEDSIYGYGYEPSLFVLSWSKTVIDPHIRLLSSDAVDGKSKATLAFLSSISLPVFPNLCEIQISSLDWPKSEYVQVDASLLGLLTNLVSDMRPECSELLAKQNDRLTDAKGTHWIPRLKRSR
jgi:hypothetical protein